MKKLILCSLAFVFLAGDLKAQSTEKAAELVTRIKEAFNSHDASAFGACFTADAEFTNVFGREAHGRDSIAIFHRPLFSATPVPGFPSFYKSTLSVYKKRIIMLSPTIAAIDIWWSQTGSIGPDGKPWLPRKGLMNTVAVEENGRWLFKTFHNMDIGEFKPE